MKLSFKYKMFTLAVKWIPVHLKDWTETTYNGASFKLNNFRRSGLRW